MTPDLPAELESASRAVISAGDQVFRQGDACHNYYIALKGCIKVFARSARGKEIVLYRVEPGDICVLTTSCMLSGTPYPADGVAEADTVAVVLPKRDFDRLMRESEEFRSFVLTSFGSRLSSLITLVEQVALESVEARLANLLLTKTSDQENVVRATHEAIASEIGSAREVVSRQLKNFASAGLVDLTRGSIVVLDRYGLDALRVK